MPESTYFEKGDLVQVNFNTMVDHLADSCRLMVIERQLSVQLNGVQCYMGVVITTRDGSPNTTPLWGRFMTDVDTAKFICKLDLEIGYAVLAPQSDKNLYTKLVQKIVADHRLVKR